MSSVRRFFSHSGAAPGSSGKPSSRTARQAVRASLALAVMLALVPAAQAMETLTYKGSLRDGDKAANGTYDLQVQLFTAEFGGAPVTFPITLPRVVVKGGSFQVPVDLPGKLPADQSVWLQAQIKPPGSSAFYPLQGRQEINSTLGGTCWETGGNFGVLNGIVGSLDSASPLVTFTNGGAQVYLRANGGFEQDSSTASGVASAAFNSSTAEAANAAAFNSSTATASNAVSFNQSTASGVNAVAVNASTARGINSFTAGRGIVQTAHTHSVVFGDDQINSFSSTAANQFMVRAQNGVGINIAPQDAFTELTLAGTPGNGENADFWLKPPPNATNQSGINISAGGATTSFFGTPFNNAAFYIDHRNGPGTSFFTRLALESNGAVVIRSSTSNANAGVQMAPGAGAWSSLSDRRLKMSVVPADVSAILSRVVALPMSTWSYIAQGDGVRHIGPMAQDFASAFRVGENDTTISTIDADGVALAAIQGLNAKLEAENSALRERLSALEAAVLGTHVAGKR